MMWRAWIFAAAALIPSCVFAQVTPGVPFATSAVAGKARCDGTTITCAAGGVITAAGGSCSPITIGTTTIACGGTATSVTGLASIGVTAPAANSTLLTSSGYSLTGSDASSLASLSGTINTSGSPDVFKIAVTNTARGANTKLLNIYGGASGTTSLFSVDSSGNAFIPTGAGLFRDNASGPGFAFHSGGNTTLVLQASNFGIGINSVNTAFFEDSSGVLALRNGVNAQQYRVYNTFTDASNNAYAMIDAGQTTANTVDIGSRSNGTGSGVLSKLRLLVDGTNRLDYGATNASALTLAANTFITGLSTTPGSKQPVCIDTTTGQLYKGSAGTC